MNCMAPLLAGLLAAASLSFQPAFPNPQGPRRPTDEPPSQKTARSPKLIAFKLFADWCPSSKAMGTVFEDLAKRYDAEPVLFCTLDFSEQRGRAQAEYLVASVGLARQWTEFGEGKTTGRVLLVDPGTRKVLASIAHDAGWDHARQALDDALSSTR